MKSKLKLSLLATAALTLSAVSSFANAAWTNPGKVTYINTYNDGFNFSLSNFEPSTCNGQKQFHVPWSVPSSKQLYSLVLTAFTTQKSVGVNWGCQDDLAVTENIDIR